MPVVAPGSLVLVTGASGHLGTHLVKGLLDSNFRVCGTVRSAAKGEYLMSLFPGQPLEFAIVEDMSKDGAYDAAVQGVAAVVHNASPVDLAYPGDPADIIGPAVQGVTGLLASLGAHNTAVRRVVQISSIAAIGVPVTGGPLNLTEELWNTEDVVACERDGAAASGFAKYHASKTLSERAFWDYFQSHPRAFDGVTILPTVIMGPFQQYTAEGADPSGSAGFLKWLLSPGLPPATNSQSVYNLVDPRDIANGMVLALTKEQAAGNRYVLSAGPQWLNDYAQVAVTEFPGKYPDAKPNTDPEFLQSLQSTAIVYDGSKITRELGLSYRPKLETIKDTMAAF